MKAKVILFSMALLLGISGLTSCKKAGCTDANSCNYDADAKTNDGTCINKGVVTFWQDSTGSQYDVVVTLNATDASITASTDTQPLCSAIGFASFSLCPGTFSYTAHEKLPGIKTWSGSVTSIEDGCSTVKLID